jgi:hypothetical protein
MPPNAVNLIGTLLSLFFSLYYINFSSVHSPTPSPPLFSTRQSIKPEGEVTTARYKKRQQHQKTIRDEDPTKESQRFPAIQEQGFS